MIRALAILLPLLLLAMVEASSQEAPLQAPLGLTWGMSKSAVEGMGVQLTPVQDDNGSGTAASARNLPRALSDIGSVYLFFGSDDRLWRIGVLSIEFEKDHYGLAGRQRFEELATLLTERYGAGSRFDRAPSDDWMAAPERFAYSLHQKQRVLGILWRSKGVSIELQLKADYQDTFYTLIYEADGLAAAARQSTKDREKGAL